MGFATIDSAQPKLLSAQRITIEADLTRGLHSFTIVGLPDKAIEESRDRVAAAIKNSGWDSPKQRNEKITIALAPADIKKEGPIFDLPIALAYLRAAGDLHFDPSGKCFAGELALDGSIRPIRGALAIAREAAREGIRELFLPIENAAEGALVEGVSVFPVATLGAVARHLDTGLPNHAPIKPIARTPIPEDTEVATSSWNDIRGQETAKRGLLIAASGGHNLAFYGPPGTGKTMLARAFAEILPSLSPEDAIEVTAIHSVAGTLTRTIVTTAPFRAPHHTASHVAIVGGGAIPKPGEATLAHRGVLFLDEFPEFDTRVIESLRQPLEEGVIHVARARGSEKFPARFILIAAMNPCPCGHLGDRQKACTCPPAAIAKYRRKLSGPIVDRIDLWIEVPRIPHEDLAPTMERPQSGPSLASVRSSVAAARSRQRERFRSPALNAHMGVRELDKHIRLSPEVERTLRIAAAKLDLSPRAYHRVIKVARTIADLAGSEDITEAHLLEALAYRPKQGGA